MPDCKLHVYLHSRKRGGGVVFVCFFVFGLFVFFGGGVVLFCFFFFAFLSYISGVHHFLGEIFAYVTVFVFSNPTIKVVTFHLRGWCVLGVFFVAGIHPSRT